MAVGSLSEHVTEDACIQRERLESDTRTYIITRVRVLEWSFGRVGKQKMEGNRQEGKVSHELVVLCVGNLLLELVMKYHPVLGRRHCVEVRVPQFDKKVVFK